MTGPMTVRRPDGYDVRTSWPALLTLVASCAIALAQSLRDDPAAALAAVLSLVGGAVLGRVLRLEVLFRRTPAWMGAVAVSAVALALQRTGLSPALAASAGVFLLPLDWGAAPRARVAVAAGFVFLILSTRDQPLSLTGVGAWGLAVVLGLILVEHDLRRASASGTSEARAGTSAAARARGWTDGAAIAAVAVLAVLIALVVLPPPAVAPSSGRTGSGGEGDAQYWGFGDRLDTAQRGQRGDEVVARVRSGSAALWRGDTYENFDGRTWTHDTGRPQPIVGRDWLTVPSDVFSDQSLAATVEETQVFTFEQGGTDLVFGAARPTSLRVPDGYASVDAASDAIHLGSPLGRGGSYTVVSERAKVTPEILRSIDPRRDDGANPLGRRDRDRLSTYLALPSTTTDRTRELARTVTAGAPTVYDQIRALEAWLGANTTYTLDVPPLPEDADAVDQYLFVDRIGFCEQIASALTVMLRSLGVPARLAVGFVPDHQDTATGDWVVLSKGAHAWVEVWFPGVGWQGFDPTASVPLAPEGDSSVQSRAADLWPAIIGFAAVVALAVGLLWLVPRLRARQARRRRPWAERAVDRLAAAGARAGRPRAPGETLVEYGRALDDSPLGGHGAPAVSRTLSRELFAPPGATAVLAGDERARTDAALDELDGASRAHRREQRRGWWRRHGRPHEPEQG